MNQINKQDNSNFHQIKQNFRESVVACVEITLKNSKCKQKKNWNLMQKSLKQGVSR